MTITSFDPFATLDRMLTRSGMQGSGRGMSALPAMDVYRRGDEYVIELEIPGVDPSDVEIDVERNMLTVSGEIRPGHEQADELVVCERPHARFRRQVYLGENLDTERIQASAENGVLTVRVPVAEQQRARKISVSAGEGRQSAIDVGASDGGDQEQQT
jgi:HSP20 family protein